MSELFWCYFLMGVIISQANGDSLQSLRRIKRITDYDCKDSAEEVPYMVSIYGNEKGRNRFICSGALLHPNFIITAEHCIANKSLEKLSVHGDTTSETRRVIKIHTPAEMNEKFKDFNIAILKLDPPFLSETSHVRPIELCDSGMDSGDQLEVSGWGRKMVHASYIPWRRCAKRYYGAGAISRYMFCGKPENKTDVCLRDAGGPVVHNGKLCGIVLWSGGWIDTKYPEIYFSLRPLQAFIMQILRKA